VGVGDYAIVHAGFAITRLDEASALDTLALFGEMGVLEEELAGEQPAGEQQRRESVA
jgi:hydrogenase expression/formation protein HypC